MDYFENIIKRLIEQEGYWVRQSVRVNITEAEKVAIGKYSTPRPEIDIVGYKARCNELLIIEVKSFLDSPGVKYDELSKEFEIPDGRFKLFTCENYRKIVFQRLVSDLLGSGMITSTPTIRFGLAAGKIYARDESRLVEYFEKKNWLLYKPSDIAGAIIELEKTPYENDPYVIAAKILLRNSRQQP
jgi:hypothetical protein